MLTPHSLAEYLVHRELIRKEAIVDGDLKVADASRRNGNFKVICTESRSYFVKQGLDTERTSSVAHEAAVYRQLWLTSWNPSLGRYLPRFYDYDAGERILIVELIEEAETLREYHVRRGRFPRNVAASLGKALGTLHSRQGAQLSRLEHAGGITEHLPWIFSVHRPELRTLHDVSGANLQLIEVIQRFPELCRSLDALPALWIPESFIHGDLKWDNCIVAAAPRTRRKTILKLVDWELAGIGDPGWDVGSVFSDYLMFWLMYMPITKDVPLSRAVEMARYPIASMRPAVRSFWENYRQHMQLKSQEANRLLMRSLHFCAARLIQSAYEQMQMSSVLISSAVGALQVSSNIFRQPEEASIHLLGISTGC
jgi:5-methylthioribose kinase